MVCTARLSPTFTLALRLSWIPRAVLACDAGLSPFTVYRAMAGAKVRQGDPRFLAVAARVGVSEADVFEP